MVTILTVLKSGGEYKPEHVVRLANQFREQGFTITCLSDIDVPVKRIPLQHNWPGWWSKMEIFRPDIQGDVFYIDLDSTVVRDPAELFTVKNPTMLAQDYHTEKVGSGVMFWPDGSREQIWNAWMRGPFFHKNGDQEFIGRTGIEIDRWQDIMPGSLVSYKCVVKPAGKVPESAKIVYFHGKPRPWEADVAPFDT